ncbi:MAG: Uma2 family endonuclease [Reinekea sp.]|nr:Uma2 family endonuclease [Reinekea sp.]
MSVDVVRHRFKTKEYYQMINVGILTENDRVELINGEIVEMSPIGFRHAACVDRLNELFTPLKKQKIIRVQNPIHLAPNSEPEPDIAIVQRRADFYVKGHPEPEDILLVIEVAESSFGYDFDVKIPLYGQVGIPEAWIVNLQDDELLVYTQPSEIGYKQQLRLQKGDEVSPQVLSFSLSVADILV